jgi:predicted aspartyl protease
MLFAFVMGAPGALAEQSCKLQMVAELPLISADGSDVVLVPVELGGKQMSMVVDTGAFASVLSETVTNPLHLEPVQIGRDMVTGATGRSINHAVKTGQFRIGPLDLSGSSMLSDPTVFGDGVAGLLGDDVLKRFDLDFDFGHHRLRLFLPDHCPGQVVYWSKQASVVPLEVRSDGHMYVPIAVDGHSLRALLDTGASRTTMYLDIASGRFGLGPDTPGVTQGDAESVLGGGSVRTYRYRFNSLTIGDITIGHPEMSLIGRGIMHTADWREMAESHGTLETLDVILGIRQLRNLHLYVATDEQKLYITPADTN